MSSRREEERSGFDYDSDPSRFASLDDYAEDDDAYVAPETFTEDVNLGRWWFQTCSLRLSRKNRVDLCCVGAYLAGF